VKHGAMKGWRSPGTGNAARAGRRLRRKAGQGKAVHCNAPTTAREGQLQGLLARLQGQERLQGQSFTSEKSAKDCTEKGGTVAKAEKKSDESQARRCEDKGRRSAGPLLLDAHAISRPNLGHGVGCGRSILRGLEEPPPVDWSRRPARLHGARGRPLAVLEKVRRDLRWCSMACRSPSARPTSSTSNTCASSAAWSIASSPRSSAITSAGAPRWPLRARLWPLPTPRSPVARRGPHCARARSTRPPDRAGERLVVRHVSRLEDGRREFFASVAERADCGICSTSTTSM